MGITYTIARNLAAKKVVTTAGEHIGVLSDLVVDEVSGQIESILVEANMDSKTMQRLGPEDRLIEVPYSAVKAVQDFVIVDERELLAKN